MKVFTYNNIPMVHIKEFAEALNRSIPSTRNLIETGNSIRKLKAFRDRSRLLIPIAELEGYPFLMPGKLPLQKGIFHYRYVKEDGKYERYMCEVCTFSNDKCEARTKADELACPKGDD